MHLDFIAFRGKDSSYGVNYYLIKRYGISLQRLSVTEFYSRGCWYPRQQNCHSKEEGITWFQNFVTGTLHYFTQSKTQKTITGVTPAMKT
jgi:hypothetical protein